MNRHHEERLVADVAEPVRRQCRDDEHVIRLELDDHVARRPAAVPLEQHERLGVRMRVEVDDPAGRSAHDEHGDVDARPLLPLEEERGRAAVEAQIVEVERHGLAHRRMTLVGRLAL